MDFTRTYPEHEKADFVERLFDGSIDGTFYPLRGFPRRAKVGDWVYASELLQRGERVLSTARTKGNFAY